ncbi:hypothetical protein [Candidatus Parabeggiatoa sp. HSG14]|uniref:hypothetical protein n=1 Tax=Candidatus Parabeggiatoa sp. HSG14 TaxID=3055593 RepID=UPI0025A81AB5|nr:hypothetical protein [Thiotrichales bacterium HSG14]
MNPNKRLTIVGKFRLNDDKPEYRFSGSGNPPKEGIFPLNPEQLFMTLQPELCFVPTQPIYIGDVDIAAVNVVEPLKAIGFAKSVPIPITSDSPLFGLDINLTHEQIQKKGGQLFEALLNNLDTLVYFYRDKFAQALHKLAREYIWLYAKDVTLKDKPYFIDQEAWYEVSFLLDVKTTIIKYLVAFPDDKAEILKEFNQVLKDNTEKQIHWLTYGNEYRDAILKALEACQKALETKDTADETFHKVAGQLGMEWLQKYVGSDYDSSDGIKEAAEGFIHYYQVFRKHSDNIHRFLRSSPLHSFVFCWLASKYHKHGDGETTPDAGAEMYQRGIKNQAERKTTDGISEWQKTVETVMKILCSVSEKEEKNKEKAEEIKDKALYKAGAEKLADDLFEVLRIKGTFKREELRKECELLFVQTAQLYGGGALQQLLMGIETPFSEYTDVYQVIINQTQALSVEEFQNRLLEKSLSKHTTEIVNQVFSEEFEYQDSCQPEIIKQNFVKVMAEDIKVQYLQAYLTKQGEIDSLSEKLEKAFQWRQRMHVDAASEYNASQIGVPGIVPLFAIFDRKNQSKRILQYQKPLIAQKQKLNIPFAKTPIALPIPVGNYKIEQVEDNKRKEIGTATVKAGENEENVEIEGNFYSKNENLKAIKSESSQLVLKGDKEQHALENENRNKLLPSVNTYLAQIEELQSKDLWEQLTEVEVKYNALVNKYENGSDLAMRLRALVLGDFILASSKNKINLDKPDLSKILGLLFDMVRYIGIDPSSQTLFDNRPSKELDEPKSHGKLDKLNLSKFYPLPINQDDISLTPILNYHYASCQKLSSVASYMQEIKELHRIFEALRGKKDIEIKLINQTLEEHVASKKRSENLLLCKDHSLFVYLTKQSNALKGLKSLETRLPKPLGVLAQRGWSAKFPLFVVKEENVNSEAFPIISNQSIALPDFSVLNVDIPNYPLLELCLSVMAKVNFGKFYFPEDDDEDYSEHFLPLDEQMQTDGIPASGESISEYLKALWFTHPVLRSNLIFLKWFNLGLQATEQGDVANLGIEFGQFLDKLFVSKNLQKMQPALKEAFDGLGDIEKSGLAAIKFKKFVPNLEPLYGEAQSPIGKNTPNITEHFTFRFKDKKTNLEQKEFIDNVTWKDWYLNKV